jgi:hypothetical protein
MRWRFLRVKGIRQEYLVGVFALKLMFGFMLALIYSEHYSDRSTGDAYRFFDDAAVIHRSYSEAGPATYLKLLTGVGIEIDTTAMRYYREMTEMERPFYTGFINDNATIIRANALAMIFSGGYYHVHTVFWCFMSMMGLTALLRMLLQFFPRKRAAMFFSVFLLPTVLFWGSGVLKEGILLLGVGLFLLGFFRYLYSEHRKRDLLFIALGFSLLLITKGYVLFCMAPAILGLLLAKLSGGRRFWLWFSIPHVAVVVLLFIGPSLNDHFKIWELMSLKQDAFYNIATESGSGSVLDLPPINQAADVLTNAPHALATTYLRPWPWEWSNLLYIPAALENLLLLICLVVMIWNFRMPYGLVLPIMAFGLSFVLVLGILTGEVVTVLGAVVRYKMPALIFLFVVIFACTDHVLLQRRLPFIRRILRKL